MADHAIHGGACPVCCWNVDPSLAGTGGGKPATKCQLCAAPIGCEATNERHRLALRPRLGRYGVGLLWAGAPCLYPADRARLIPHGSDLRTL